MKTVAVRDLKAGDYVVPAKATVTGIQKIAGLVIVDFDDNTATPPIPGNAAVKIVRK